MSSFQTVLARRGLHDVPARPNLTPHACIPTVPTTRDPRCPCSDPAPLQNTAYVRALYSALSLPAVSYRSESIFAPISHCHRHPPSPRSALLRAARHRSPSSHPKPPEIRRCVELLLELPFTTKTALEAAPPNVVVCPPQAIVSASSSPASPGHPSTPPSPSRGPH
jgi:hypothetical protein